MICFKCSAEDFATRSAIIHQEFRGEKLDVTAPVSVCQACGWQTMGPGQTDELRRLTADAYRANHGLLTSAEIVGRRTRLAMNQREFAAFLRVGEASVKRWETWQVQDASSDELIRMKTDFLSLLQQATQQAMQHQFVTTYLAMTFSVKEAGSSAFYLPRFQPEPGGFKNEFSLLKCRQTTPGGYPGRICCTNESDQDYDTAINIAAAA